MILNLLQLEWKKFKHYRTFKVMGILYLILLPLMLIVGKAFFKAVEAPADFINLSALMRLPDIWPYLGYIGNWLSFFFLGFIGVLCVTTEFANKTLRQNIINGVTRNEFFIGKITFIFTICLIATLYFTAVGYTFGFLHTENVATHKITAHIDMIPRFFLMSLGYMVFGFFLGVIFRRSGIALFLYLAYVIFLEAVIRYGIHGKIYFDRKINFYPINAIEDLAPIPIPTIVKEITEENNLDLLLSPTEATITTCVYLSIFIFVAYRIIKKSDL